ncbi:uncharacterized protein Z518_10642 [Rhinocladiella mackenziei CBS 650.93]|uniref:Amino acid permease/ SLC12A domain-containing protein n=1 Tax=Rhinocladiella mackenziei CBS 650.93 TaxID=1442369 RepID=A0A0D2FET3_9EURO|nr:uncharacterized protein Z518_10642 [Rhinocladiella mackenziei CBS 650.93]KIX00502.1 hypothetical protein Z518_10642 [Rhinocladiella mackenziei CBS 650.93]
MTNVTALVPNLQRGHRSVCHQCCQFLPDASSRAFQVLATNGTGPQFLRYIDKAGRLLWWIVLRLLFGLYRFSRRSQCVRGRKYYGYSTSQLPYRTLSGVYGSYLGLFLNCTALMATVDVSLFPLGGKPAAKVFFENHLAVRL